ncbi:MAG: sugar-binding protein [Verrucomicrobiota bacterium]
MVTQQAFEDVHTFTGEFLDTYFKLVRDTFNKYDTHHMLIGCRLQPGTINSQQLCREAGKYLDIMSFNYYTDGFDKDFLTRVYAWTGRPFMLSEFYWSSLKESGLVGSRAVDTQQERGLAYRNYVENAASLGFVVGIEWFTLVDQAATGRWFEGMSGERANTGLFSVTDRPWKPMVEEMKKTNDSIYEVELGKRPPYVFDNPLFVVSDKTRREVDAPRAIGAIAINGATTHWPGNPPDVISGKSKAAGDDSAQGTFRLCWDDQNLYVLVNVLDSTPLQNKQTNPAYLWSGDAVELFIGSEKLDEGGPLRFTDRHLAIGAGTPGKAPIP